MSYLRRWLWPFLALSLSACVTVNIYFPAAAAQKLADKVVEEVYQAGSKGTAPAAPATPAAPTASPAAPGPMSALPSPYQVVGLAITEGFAAVSGTAQAQQADLNAESPGVRQARARLEALAPQLQPYLASGAVGLTNNGLVAVRDLSAVPLAARARVSALVAQDNSARMELYQQIAAANGHPEWAAQIQETFARTWIAKAQPGWWYQDASGQWRQK